MKKTVALTLGVLSVNSLVFLSTPMLARQYPLSYVYNMAAYDWDAGKIVSGTSFWSATAVSSNNALHLGLIDYGNYPSYENKKQYGSALRSTSPRRYPLSYVFSGWYYVGSGTLNDQGSVGGHWTTSAVDSSLAYNLYILSSGNKTSDQSWKYSSYALRYVSKEYAHSSCCHLGLYLFLSHPQYINILLHLPY